MSFPEIFTFKTSFVILFFPLLKVHVSYCFGINVIFTIFHAAYPMGYTICVGGADKYFLSILRPYDTIFCVQESDVKTVYNYSI